MSGMRIKHQEKYEDKRFFSSVFLEQELILVVVGNISKSVIWTLW